MSERIIRDPLLVLTSDLLRLVVPYVDRPPLKGLPSIEVIATTTEFDQEAARDRLDRTANTLQSAIAICAKLKLELEKEYDLNRAELTRLNQLIKEYNTDGKL
jgi:hypothetical protein